MALNKQPVNVNFAQGVNTKIDKWQLPVGQFRSLTNTVFTKDGLMQKRNGYQLLTNAPVGAQTLSTLNNGLVALGQTCQSYSTDSGQLTNAGNFQPMQMSVSTMVRRATSQLTCDVAVASNGLACSVWSEANGSSYYQISDSITGQIVIPAVLLPSTAAIIRTYALGGWFLVSFLVTASGVTHLRYIAIPISNPAAPHLFTDFGSISEAASLSAPYDAQVYSGVLYIAWENASGGISVTSLTSNLTPGTVATIASTSATYISVTVDSSNISNPVIWVSQYNSGTIKAAAFNSNVVLLQANTTVVTGLSGINELTSSAIYGVLTVIYEVANTYTFSPNAKTDYIASNTLTGTTPGTPIVVLRGVGLASRAAIVASLGKTVVLATYGQAYQPTYFLIDLNGNVLARLAYSNGIGYLYNQVLPNINQNGNQLQIGYLYADQLQAVNKTQGQAGQIGGVFAQYGINLAIFSLGGTTAALEIGGSLHPSGGMLWQYDGVKIRELGFNVWPEDIQGTPNTTGGLMSAQQYYYQFCYEWTDAAGQIHRSAPSVPLAITTTSATASVTLNIPTLRQTYKTDNKVRIVGYRWSTAQQEYFQFTSTSNPTLNDPTVDSIVITDTLNDSSILGDNLIYTTGGVIEDICAPAAVAMTLFQSRLFLADAEDPNLIWFSKQVIEATPVEMSDLLTLYIAPTTGAQGSTGPITALSSMDNNLIIFKKDAIYYVNGSGPDNTGSNGTFSDPVYITSTVGCSNPGSIILTPNGIMFQSDKGIWLLGRDLSTQYIGAPVEDYVNNQTVTSALAIPGTNQVRFTLDNKTAVMYDYYFNRWGNWVNVPCVSSCLLDSLHTYLNDYGQIVQETPGVYLDVTTPVLMAFTTSWYNLAGLQGFQRFTAMNLLGQYMSPHTLQVSFAYNYNDGILDSYPIRPVNYAGTYGVLPTIYGGGVYGGASDVEKWRVFPQVQKCSSFQITVNETYDSTYGVPAGAGLTLSGIVMLVGVKRGTRTESAGTSVG